MKPTIQMRAVTRIDSPGFLDLDMPQQLFQVLKRSLLFYASAKAKRIDDALLLVFGLAHLREWIAPGFTGQRAKRGPRNPAERFSAALHQLPSYQLLRNLANHAKHQFRDESLAVRSVHYVNIDDWPDIDRVNSFDDGPVMDYFVGEHDLVDLFEEVMTFYDDRWFSLSVDEQMGSREERTRNVLKDDDKYHR